ncbi:hypothetical protein CFIICLFH_3823 [Methylobacterium goesingense]|nr:hypothetical protein CFIICLFH_3823 [Methylobacterium goesingense]
MLVAASPYAITPEPKAAATRAPVLAVPPLMSVPPFARLMPCCWLVAWIVPALMMVAVSPARMPPNEPAMVPPAWLSMVPVLMSVTPVLMVPPWIVPLLTTLLPAPLSARPLAAAAWIVPVLVTVATPSTVTPSLAPVAAVLMVPALVSFRSPLE